MASKTPYERGNELGLSKAEVDCLFRIVVWFNGCKVRVHDRVISIATAYEPTLRQVFGDSWEPRHDEAHDRLINRGLLKSEDRGESIYIAGRRCRWLPTQHGMQVIEELFPTQDQIYPNWVLDEHSGPPTYRDGSELMEHRKGVLAARHMFQQEDRVLSVDTYPRINLPQRPDLRLFRGNADQMARVEVLTDHNNRESWRTKFRQWRSNNAGPTIWFFENRKHTLDFIHHLIAHGIIDLDGGRFGGRAENWSRIRVNDRLRRSRQGPMHYNSHDAMWTIPGILEASRADVFEFLKRNNIILQS